MFDDSFSKIGDIYSSGKRNQITHLGNLDFKYIRNLKTRKSKYEIDSVEKDREVSREIVNISVQKSLETMEGNLLELILTTSIEGNSERFVIVEKNEKNTGVDLVFYDRDQNQSLFNKNSLNQAWVILQCKTGSRFGNKDSKSKLIENLTAKELKYSVENPSKVVVYFDEKEVSNYSFKKKNIIELSGSEILSYIFNDESAFDKWISLRNKVLKEINWNFLLNKSKNHIVERILQDI